MVGDKHLILPYTSTIDTVTISSRNKLEVRFQYPNTLREFGKYL
jgi:hypothetical protein